jgi:hypothetical protein
MINQNLKNQKRDPHVTKKSRETARKRKLM